MSQHFYNNGVAYKQAHPGSNMRQSVSYSNIGHDYLSSGQHDQGPLPPLATNETSSLGIGHSMLSSARLQPHLGPLPALRENVEYAGPSQAQAPLPSYTVSGARTNSSTPIMLHSGPSMSLGPDSLLPRRTEGTTAVPLSRPLYTSIPSVDSLTSKCQLSPGNQLGGDPRSASWGSLQSPSDDALGVHTNRYTLHQPYSNSTSPAPQSTFPSQSRTPVALAKHVVGSQGRRGILPSAAGRPPAITDGSLSVGSKLPNNLAKDSEGKYLCPHCNKPYLHAKHLKRHMLRHTGVRPYECALCHDTFSRSDILKRHFQKCSVRRGNPTGQHHLAYTRANKRAAKALQREEEKETRAGASSTATSSALYPARLDSPSSVGGAMVDHPRSISQNSVNEYGMCGNEHSMTVGGLELGQAAYERQQSLASQLPRSNGLRTLNSIGDSSNRGSASSLTNSNFEQPNSAFSTSNATPDSMTTSGAATPYSFSHDPKSLLNSPADGTFPPSLGVRVVTPTSNQLNCHPSSIPQASLGSAGPLLQSVNSLQHSPPLPGSSIYTMTNSGPSLINRHQLLPTAAASIARYGTSGIDWPYQTYVSPSHENHQEHPQHQQQQLQHHHQQQNHHPQQSQHQQQHYQPQHSNGQISDDTTHLQQQSQQHHRQNHQQHQQSIGPPYPTNTSCSPSCRRSCCSL